MMDEASTSRGRSTSRRGRRTSKAKSSNKGAKGAAKGLVGNATGFFKDLMNVSSHSSEVDAMSHYSLMSNVEGTTSDVINIF